MTTRMRYRWFYPWVPFGIVTVLGGLIVWLLLLNPPGSRAQAGQPALDGPAGIKEGGQLVVAVTLTGKDRLEGQLRAELLGPGGKVIDRLEKAVDQTADPEAYRFEFPVPKVPLDQLTVRYTFGKKSLERPLKGILLAKPHETTLAAGQELHAGSTASLRCVVQGVRSLTETVPHHGASVQVRLQSRAGKVYDLATRRTDADGSALVRFKVPAVPPGQYRMEVVTRSALGTQELKQDVRVRAEPKVLLVTDKPLYQPGQQIHIRALALGSFDLAPVGETPLTFEVEDSKGNKVFKREQATSEYGVASIDFQLASEVNTGEYRVRALLAGGNGNAQSEKVVTVKPYVLPKFKTAITTDKTFYLPKETVKAELQVDYNFGKPVAGATVKVSASTFDVAFKEFQTWDGKTDEHGHAKFEVKLPDYFVGQPLAKGNALVRLEATVTDTAEHTEKTSRTWTVSDQPIKVSLIPEAGRLMPGIENRVFAAAIYPDGSPARCNVKVWLGQSAGPAPVAPGRRGGAVPPGLPVPVPPPARRAPGAPGKPAAPPPADKLLATLKTSESGLAEFTFTPKADQFRPGQWGAHNVEVLGGTRQVLGPKNLLDLHAQAIDTRGNKGITTSTLSSEPLGENVLLRLDRAVYKGGDTLAIDIRSSAGLPTVYLDLVKSGQTLLTQWLDVKDGKASHKVALPAEVFGTIEVHAYQMLASGEIIRDARVIYVQPASDLRIKVKADRDVYLPGQDGKIRFEVTDSSGKPATAALGVIVVDEAVYTLQELQPGLEKVYFTLQEELMKPKAQAIYRPSQGIDTLVLQPELPVAQQQAAQVLLAAVQPKPPARWLVDPAAQRRREFDGRLQQIGMAVWSYATQPATEGRGLLTYDRENNRWQFKEGLLDDLVKADNRNQGIVNDPLGGRLSLEGLGRLEKDFSADALGRSVTRFRLQKVVHALINQTTMNQAKYFKDGKWQITDAVLAEAIKRVQANWRKDAWGREFHLVRLEKKRENQQGRNQAQLDYHDIVSAGPDGKVGTDDDVTVTTPSAWRQGGAWWGGDDEVARAKLNLGQGVWRGHNLMMRNRARDFGAVPMEGAPARGGFPLPPMAAAPGGRGLGAPQTKPDAAPRNGGGAGTGGDSAAAPPARVRESFPETMLWQPQLITDSNGIAELPVAFADSITTWRLTASASSKGGRLGGVSAPLRVFQDFFVDLDLPVALTQNDEVAFPVAVYNYLKTPQKVTLDLNQEDWFELVEGTTTRTLELKPGEVTGVKYRIRAKKIGSLPLLVKARGSKTSDAIRRLVEVVPDGQRKEVAFNGELKGKVTQRVVIPADAVADASKILVKVYPGVFSQVLEGTEGMLRMPNGCFEQTSSSAYPNILVVDYVKSTKAASPQILMKAEQYLNVGYQRLLTFERPGGGFDWWGRGEPLIWLSAYGLQEFNDMARVYPIDRGVIERTQRWLLKQQEPDGTWSKIGATHGVSITRMGDPKLLLTSYVAWSLLDSGLRLPQLEKSITYIREHVKKADNAYILALAANALAAWDRDDDSTLEVIQRLLKKQKEVPDVKGCCFPAGGQSLSYSRGDSLTVETTALTALAMLKTRQFAPVVNKTLAYLVKMKNPSGTWGSTQATILALKALVRGAGGTGPKGEASFTILVNGKKAAEGKVTEKDADVMRLFDLKEHTRAGENEVTLEVKGDTGLMYQVVGRHYEPWSKAPPAEPVLDVRVDYDRTKLSTADLLRAKATLKYNGKVPTYQVIVDLPIPPGFTADPGDFGELVGAKKIERFSMTSRQVILYLGDIKPGDVRVFEYGLKPKFPLRAKSPSAVAYEYYTPAHRAESKPVELTVVEK
jgi:uncharacterized protein YfaS (alpha-2-macroglobulin family)